MAMEPQWEQFRFRHPFRKYQRVILNQIQAVIDTPRDDRRYHIVAPPGSGKTIIGLELIGRFRRPALILAPTVTIQMQWYERLRMFLPDNACLEEWATLTPERKAPLRIFTYQRLAVQDPEQPFVESASRLAWAEDLTARGLASDLEAAQRYLDELCAGNPEAYREEIRRRYPRLKRRLLQADPETVARFLHPNALRLIEDLAADGIGTIVLDECHHLLDYWAVVLRYLIRRLDQPRVIGLTATLPSPEDDFAYENYTTLLGDVDFEVPTPAVVKEGNLAPYRELAWFTEPTPEERGFLREQDRLLRAVLEEVLAAPRFRSWLKGLLFPSSGATSGGPDAPEGERAGWLELADEDPTLVIAGLRWLRDQGELPPETPLPPEAGRRLTQEDRLILLEHYALRVLLPSPDPNDRRRFMELRRLRPLGYTLTPKGLRPGRSPMDLILAFSDSKIEAARQILRAEKEGLGERLRAVLVVDFEQSTSGLRRLRREADSSDADLGSGRRVFRRLIQDPELADLHPIFVTGRSLWIAAGFRPIFQGFWEEFRRQHGMQIELTLQRRPGYYEVRGKGSDWGTRVYVPLITRMMEQGLTRLLIGTRKIFGEGWDALSLNTLIDLTGVTTSTSVQQLRGRSLRLDPGWPHKVAHNWDVVCIAPEFEWGDLDLRRFWRRHNHLWGVAIPANPARYAMRLASTLLTRGLPPNIVEDLRGQIVRGAFHVEPLLGLLLALEDESWKHIPYATFNDIMREAAARREETWAAWGIGRPYLDFEIPVYRIQPRDMRLCSVHTLRESAAAMWRILRWVLAGAIFYGLLIFSEAIARLRTDVSLAACLFIASVSIAAGLVITVIRERKAIARALRVLLIEVPPDAILLDLGQALAEALRETGQASPALSSDGLRVIADPDGAYRVQLEGVPLQDAEVFIRAYRELFRPIRNSRYLILRQDERLPDLLRGGLWQALRSLIPPMLRRPAYHPVPQTLGVRRPDAEAFARAWRRYVGEAELIYTRSPEGRRHLDRARLQEPLGLQDLLLGLWQ
jgi:hypothetical protein